MRAFLARIPQAILARWRRRPFRTPREWLFRLLPWAFVLAGLVLIFVSVIPEVRTVDTVRLPGSLAAGQVRNETFSETGFTYAEAFFEDIGSCGVRVYVLDPRRAAEYRDSGVLPNPETSLNCDRTSAVYQEGVDTLVFQNAFVVDQSYSVRFDLVLVSHPYALVAFPAFALFLFGGAVVIIRTLREGLIRTVEDLAESEAYEPRGRDGRG